MTLSGRYQNKPLLRLLECYVLWTIDELPEDYAHRLEQMTPKLQKTYNVKGEWHEVITQAVELPPNMPILIRELWTKNTEIARNNGVTLEPQQFAEMFVDQNLL